MSVFIIQAVIFRAFLSISLHVSDYLFHASCTILSVYNRKSPQNPNKKDIFKQGFKGNVNYMYIT